MPETKKEPALQALFCYRKSFATKGINGENFAKDGL